jgi:hypothetical protein
MTISHSYSRFTTSGQEEIEQAYPRIAPNRWYTLRIKDIVESTTKKGDPCFIQSSEFVEAKTPFVIRTYYMPSLEWSIVRMDNLFRNLGHSNRSADVRGAEFEAFIVEKEFEDKKLLQIKKASLWLKELDYQQEYGTLKAPQQTPTGIPQSSLSTEPLIEDEIPF